MRVTLVVEVTDEDHRREYESMLEDHERIEGEGSFGTFQEYVAEVTSHYPEDMADGVRAAGFPRVTVVEVVT